MTDSARNQLRAAIAAAQACEDERGEQRRQEQQERAERLRQATETAGPLIDVLQTFLDAMARHGNPGLEEVMLSTRDGQGGRNESVPAGKQGWRITDSSLYPPLWVCPDGTGVGGSPYYLGTATTQVVPLHEAVRDYLASNYYPGVRDPEGEAITRAGAILQQYRVKF